MIFTFIFISSRTQQIQINLRESLSTGFIDVDIRPRTAETLRMDTRDTPKDSMKKVRGKASWDWGSGDVWHLEMEEKEKPSRETNKKGRCHEIQEKKTVFRIEESTMSNATEKLERMKRPTIHSVKNAAAQGTMLKTNQAQTKHYYFE